MVKPPLISFYPHISVPATCVKCQSDSIQIHDFLFEGIHVLVDGTCQKCNTRFYHTMPIGHDANTPIAISHDGTHSRYDPSAKVWLAQPLIEALFNKSSRLEVEITKKNLAPLKETVILLNCLDDCFGHVYVKMLNAQMLLEAYPEYSLILLIPGNVEWLVPNGVAELWIVSGSMHDMKKQITNLQGFVKSQLSQMSRCYLSTAKVFHDLPGIDSEMFLKTKKFDISQFDKLPHTITFVLREDRFWHANPPDDFINRAFIKLKIRKYFKQYFVWRQNRLVKKAIFLISKVKPNVKFNITGIGTLGRFGNDVRDLRTLKPNLSLEKQWCDTYATSHIVIGVHGSNMLIPTSLAAGFIGILPRYKIAHLGEDTVLHHAGRHAIFLGRHVDVFSTPALVAQHAINMLTFDEVARLMKDPG